MKINQKLNRSSRICFQKSCYKLGKMVVMTIESFLSTKFDARWGTIVFDDIHPEILKSQSTKIKDQIEMIKTNQFQIIVTTNTWSDGLMNFYKLFGGKILITKVDQAMVFCNFTISICDKTVVDIVKDLKLSKLSHNVSIMASPNSIQHFLNNSRYRKDENGIYYIFLVTLKDFIFVFNYLHSQVPSIFQSMHIVYK